MTRQLPTTYDAPRDPCTTGRTLAPRRSSEPPKSSCRPSTRRLTSSLIALVLALGLTACDRHPSARIQGKLIAPQGVAGALVLPLDGARDAFVVDPLTGEFKAWYGAISVATTTIPLFVYVPGQRPLVLTPGRDFTLEPHDGALIADLQIDTTRARQPHPLPLTCLGDQCTADLPPEAGACRASLILLDGPRALLVSPGEREVKGGERIVSLLPMLEGRPRSLVLVVVCPNDDYVTDVAQFDDY
ncbi:hypothetical protein [Chondromyces crocatus]|uniref:Uncharacterized protein n=1 Tax=Chondromyces crocatus TaxID=52 RepID=A0A0K1EC71_CHOCO|nr:hypothetical protein [Chondromyces crocatus]AKT38481.1 uncharacterized protein CMC5_026280 [Chondromyces crocatus]